MKKHSKIRMNKFKLTPLGFTLVELLSIIVILAIIATITIPIVIDFINDAKKGTAMNSAHGLVKAANYYYQKTIMKDESERNFNGSTDVLPYLELEGNKPDKGKVYINEDGEIALAVIYNKTCITKYFTTELYENDDTENCGVYTDFTVPSSYVAFGGEYQDIFSEVIKTSDNGYVAVGNTNSETYDNLKSHGSEINDDAIVVKYDQYGNIVWSKNFGGSGHDFYYTVIEEDNCYTVAGVINSLDGDVTGMTEGHAIVVVKYSKDKGNVIFKKVLYTSNKTNTDYNISSVIKNGNNYYVLIKSRYILNNNSISYVVKYDENFNEIWINNYNDNYYSEIIGKMVKSTKNTLVFLTTGYKLGGQLNDIQNINTEEGRYTAVFEISMDDGTILGKTAFGGNNLTTPKDIVEISDGYIIVGSETSTTNHFQNLNKGSSDAYIAKIGKNANSNGFLPILWIKTFGGTESEQFSSVVIDNENIVVGGYSYSNDFDMANLEKSLVNAIIVKYDFSGNVVDTKTVGGSNNDQIKDIIIDGENYVLAGSFFSKDGDMQNFNYGNNDAILMKIDKNLTPIVSFQLRPVLLNKLPDMIKNYGTSIPTVEGRDSLELYTTNNPGKNLGAWCAGTPEIDPNGNYAYVDCLKPFNSANSKTIYDSRVQYENEINLTTDPNNWILIHINFGSAGKNIEISNLKIKFKNQEATTIKDAVDLGYIEPLVITGIRKGANYFFENSYNILYGGNSGLGDYPGTRIMFKPKNIELEQITFDSNKETDLTVQGYCRIYQLYDFDISLTKAQ